MDIRPVFKKAHFVLKENVRALMAARHVRQLELALWCGHGKSWLNKWLNNDREIQFKDLDRLADFFGMLPHELFTPGISSLTERRTGIQRRKGADRRMSFPDRLGAAKPRAPQHAAPHAPDLLPARPPLTDDIRALAKRTADTIAKNTSAPRKHAAGDPGGRSRSGPRGRTGGRGDL